LAELPRRQPTVDQREIGRLRFEMLDGLGLGDPDSLSARVAGISTADLESLAYGVLDLAKASVDRLLEDSSSATPSVVLWAEHDAVAEVLGRTLLWADHYLVRDPLADALLTSRLRSHDIEQGIRKLLDVRSLTELGVVVPVPSDLATTVSATPTHDATEADLRHVDLVSWVDQQLMVEGPTAREALIISARDDLPLGGDRLYFHAHIGPESLDEESHTLHTRLLGDYRPGFDYGPWIAQSRQQVVADLIQATNRSISVAETFGGHAVTRAPFRARLLQQKNVEQDPTSALVWAEVPWLPEASPHQLAQIAAEDDAVEALRARARRAFGRAGGGDLATVAESLAGELEEAARQLEGEMRNTRSWALLRPAPLLALSVGLGVTIGPVGAISALAGAVAATLPAVGGIRQQRKHPAYALVMAKRGNESA
jgi:hypothetical protein